MSTDQTVSPTTNPAVDPTTDPILDDATATHVAAIAADTRPGAHVAIVAPGGHGKTTLLHHIGRAIHDATGAPTRLAQPPFTQRPDAQLALERPSTQERSTSEPPTPEPPTPEPSTQEPSTQQVGRPPSAQPFGEQSVGEPLGGVLLVDDAHLLDDDTLRRLAATRARLVIAARPWPRSAALTALLDLAQDQLVLAPFDPNQVRAALRDRPRTDRLAEFVHAQTGGVPGFVARLARAASRHHDGTRTPDHDAAEHTRTTRAANEFDIPRAVLAEFRPELARLDDTVLRFLLAADAGVGLHRDLLVDLLETPGSPQTVHEIIEAARATGLVGTTGSLLPIAQRALRALVPVERRAWMRQRLAELQLARGGQVLPLMRPLATTGIGGASAAAAFEAAAGEALPTDPALAARLYAAAVTAGKPGVEVGARRAEALALAGDLDGALRLADEVLTTETAPRRKAAAAVAAAALAHRGQLARSGQLYRWAGVHHLAAIATIGTGEQADRQEPDGPPTSLWSAIELMAQGLRESVTGTPTTALSMLVRAAGTLEPVGRNVLLPDSPAALGSILALHYGELGTATSLLERAIAAGTGGAPLATRHRLLLAWIAMVRGNLTEAGKALATTRAVEPRDRLFAVAIELGVARRAGDAAALG
ncbi:MAG: hypothetical protein ACRDTB_25550, partial [Actinophytocola sp.]